MTLHITSFTFYGYITNSQSDQLPDGLIALSVEHCTEMSEVMGSKILELAAYPRKFKQVLMCGLLLNYDFKQGL